MTQDNKIWYNFGECAKPNSFVLKRHNIDGSFELVKTSDSGFMQIGELLRGKWCYIDDLIASSKALDVAIDALKRLRDVPDEDNNQWFNYCCPRCVLQEISEIMKGGE